MTARGRRQAEELIEHLTRFGPFEIHSSPYERAVATVAPTAEYLGVSVRTRWDLREWDDGLATTKDWKILYDRCWSDPACSYGDGESHAGLIGRASAALDDLLTRSEHCCVIAASHGTWIARGFQGLGIANPYKLWNRMPTPAIYQLHRFHHNVTVTGPALGL